MVKEKFESAEYSSLSQDESPEEISLSTTKADSLGRLKGQGKAREAEKERRKAADLSRKAQLAEQRARVQAALLELQKDAPASAKPASHPQTLVETRVIKFESEDEEETEDLPKGYLSLDHKRL